LKPDKPALNRISVLLVDDDEDDYIITRDILKDVRGTEYALKRTGSFDAALAMAAEQDFDVYLLDYRLGFRTGVDLLKGILLERPHAPVILLTGQNDDTLDVLAMNEGASDFLVKGEITAPLLERSIRYAIKHASMAEALHQQAIHDGLTQLYNRRAMERFLDEEESRFRRHGTPYAVMLIDLDFFKAVNDTHGHQTGDDVLRHVARLLREMARESDRAARYGGEEFAIIAPQSTAKEIFAFAERYRQAVCGEAFALSPGESATASIRLSVSAGIADCPGNGHTWPEVLHAADQALYKAKDRGRNQTILSEIPFVAPAPTGEPLASQTDGGMQ
jgi:diguanylate cyclase (GGDEF)-like protein